jgi:WD40 repeat protein
LDGHTKEIDDLAIDPQGRWLVSGSWDKTARIWDLHDRETTSIQLTVNDGGIESFVLAPDGRWLVTWAEGKDARLWDLEHLRAEPRVLPGHKLGTWSVAFDPKGRWVANEGLGETVLLWDLQHPSPAVPLGGHNRVGLLVFDPDGRWFVTTDSATARLWDLQHLESGARVLHGGAGGMKSVAFDPGGRWLATESADGIVRLWRLHLVPLLDLACRTAGRNLTLGEWQQHVGGIDYQVTCTQFPSGEILAEKAASGSP